MRCTSIQRTVDGFNDVLGALGTVLEERTWFKTESDGIMPRYDITGQCLFGVGGHQNWTVQYEFSLAKTASFIWDMPRKYGG